MQREPLICGIDIGTSTIKAIVFKSNGEAIAAAERSTPVLVLGKGSAEHDIDELTNGAMEALREALSRLDDRSCVRSIAVASFGEAGTLIDQKNRPCGPVIAWYDTRTLPDLERLFGRISAFDIQQITGLCPDPTFSLLKLLWFKREHDFEFENAVRWLNMADYLGFKLSGEMATDSSLASRTMALDLNRGTWSKELLKAADISQDLFAPLCPMGMKLGPVCPEIASNLGLDPTCVVATGGHDHVAGAIAIGADKPGTLMDSMGTAEALSLARTSPLIDPEIGARGINQGMIHIAGQRSYYLFGGLPTSAGAIEWFRREIARDQDYAELIKAAIDVPAGSLGVGFMPHLRIGSPPFPDPVARGGFFGVGADVNEAVLFRAVLEGIALDTAHILRSMSDGAQANQIDRIIAIGGSTKNELLLAIKASLYDRPTEVASMPEAVCLGAAMLGGLAAGVYDSLEQAQSACRPNVNIIEPCSSTLWGDPADLIDLYGRRYELFRQLYQPG